MSPAVLVCRVGPQFRLCQVRICCCYLAPFQVAKYRLENESSRRAAQTRCQHGLFPSTLTKKRGADQEQGKRNCVKSAVDPDVSRNAPSGTNFDVSTSIRLDSRVQVKQRPIKFGRENFASGLNGRSHPGGSSTLIAVPAESSRSPFPDRSTIGDCKGRSD